MMFKFLKIGCLGFIGLAVLVALFGGGGGNNQSSNRSSSSSSSNTQVEQQAPKNYMEVDVAVMMSDLENNAASAQKKYKGKDVKVTGKLGTIDSDGDYISIQPDDQFAVRGVHCTVNKKDKAQEDFVMNLKKNQQVTAYGTITDVGELMAYTMKVDKFE